MTKQLVFALAGIVLIAACDRKPNLKSDEERTGYALGQQIGKNFKAQNIEVDAKALAHGISDASKGQPARMTDQEIQEAMMKLQEKARAKVQAEGEKNKAAAQEFLNKHKTEADVKTTASGLQYKVIKEGSGKSPTQDDIVKVHYTGTLITGEKFDSSVDRGTPAEFPVGGVIPGWTEALKLMKTGEKWKLVIPPELAYGPEGRPGIPPNSVLVFDVELLEVKAGTKPAAPGDAKGGKPAKGKGK